MQQETSGFQKQTSKGGDNKQTHQYTQRTPENAAVDQSMIVSINYSKKLYSLST